MSVSLKNAGRFDKSQVLIGIYLGNASVTSRAAGLFADVIKVTLISPLLIKGKRLIL